MRRLAALVAAVLALLLVAPAQAQAHNRAMLEVDLALTSRGPQVYESGHDPGWSLATDVFVNQYTNATAMGPIIHGRPRHPVVRVMLYRHPVHLAGIPLKDSPRTDDWIAPHTGWLPGVVVFFTPGGGQCGLGEFFDVVEPWPTKRPTLTSIGIWPEHAKAILAG